MSRKFETTVIHTIGQPGGSMPTGGAARAGSQRSGGVTVEQARAVYWQQFRRRLDKATSVRPKDLDKMKMFKVDYIMALAMAIIAAGTIKADDIEDALSAIPPSGRGRGDGFTKTLHRCEGTRVIKKTVPQDNQDLVAAVTALMAAIDASIPDDGGNSRDRRDLAQYLLQSNFISLPERYFAAWFLSGGGWVPLADIETFLFDLDQLTSLKKNAWVKFGGRETVGGQEIMHVTLVMPNTPENTPDETLVKALAECDVKEREVDPKGYVIVNKMKKTVLMTDEKMTEKFKNVMNLMCAGTVALTKVRTVMRCPERALIKGADSIMYLKVPILKSGASSITVEYEFGNSERNRPNQKIRVNRERPVVSAAQKEEWDDADEPVKDYRKYHETVMHDIASIVQQMVARMNAA